MKPAFLIINTLFLLHSYLYRKVIQNDLYSKYRFTDMTKKIIETKHMNFVICRDAFKAINNLYLTLLSSISETNIVSDKHTV